MRAIPKHANTAFMSNWEAENRFIIKVEGTSFSCDNTSETLAIDTPTIHAVELITRPPFTKERSTRPPLYCGDQKLWDNKTHSLCAWFCSHNKKIISEVDKVATCRLVRRSLCVSRMVPKHSHHISLPMATLSALRTHRPNHKWKLHQNPFTRLCLLICSNTSFRVGESMAAQTTYPWRRHCGQNHIRRKERKCQQPLDVNTTMNNTQARCKQEVATTN